LSAVNNVWYSDNTDDILKIYICTYMCIYERYSRVRVGKNVSDRFPIRNGLKQGDALSPIFFNFALEYAIRRVQVKRGWLETEWYTSAAGLC